MAKYEIHITPLTEAADSIHSIADDLYAVQGRLSSILSEMPECLRGLREQISFDCGAIGDLHFDAKKLSQALLEISEIYEKAERSVFNTDDNTKQSAAPANVPLPIIYRVQGFFIPGSLILPDWLQVAVLKYEQSLTS